jgi:hypothetical protein
MNLTYSFGKSRILECSKHDGDSDTSERPFLPSLDVLNMGYTARPYTDFIVDILVSEKLNKDEFLWSFSVEVKRRSNLALLLLVLPNNQKSAQSKSKDMAEHPERVLLNHEL